MISPQPDGASDRHEDGMRVAGARQVDEGHAVAEPVGEVRGAPDGERRLARAARAGERQEPDGAVRQAIRDLRDLARPADQRGDPRRQVGRPRPGGDQRREVATEVGVDELEEMLGAAEVPEVVLAEVAKLRAGAAVARARARRRTPRGAPGRRDRPP